MTLNVYFVKVFDDCDEETASEETEYEYEYDGECDTVFDVCDTDCLSINEIDDTVFNR